eukprot:403349876
MPQFITHNKTHINLKPKLTDVGQYNLILYIKDLIKTRGQTEAQYTIKVRVKQKAFIRDEDGVLNQTQNNSHQVIADLDLSMKVDISQNQVATITFSKNIIITKDYKARLLKGLKLTLFGSDNINVNIDWDVLDFNEKGVKLKLRFSDPLQISVTQDPDKLRLQVQDSNLFVAQDTQKPLNLNQFQEDIPAQLDEDSFQDLDTANDVIAQVLQTVLYGSAVIGSLSGASLSVLWGLINTLQLVTHTPLFSIPYTANILNFLQSIFQVVNFDLFNIQDILQQIFQLESPDYYDPYNIRFQFIGYDNSNFMYLIGAPLIFFFLDIILALLFPLLKMNDHNLCKKLQNYLRPRLFYSSYLLFFIEMALEITFSCIINLKNPESSHAGEVLSILIGATFFLLVQSLAIFVPILIWKMQQVPKLYHKIHSKLEAILEDLNFKNYWASMFFHSGFIWRRSMFVFVVFYFEEHLCFQLQIFIISNLIWSVYLFSFKPISTNLWTEVFNEICTLLFSSLMLIYTDWVPYGRIRYQCGYLFIALFVFNITVNIIVLLLGVVSRLIFTYKTYILMKKVAIVVQSKSTLRQRKHPVYDQIMNASLNEQRLLKSKVHKQLTIIQEDQENEIEEDFEGLDSQRPLNFEKHTTKIDFRSAKTKFSNKSIQSNMQDSERKELLNFNLKEINHKKVNSVVIHNTKPQNHSNLYKKIYASDLSLDQPNQISPQEQSLPLIQNPKRIQFKDKLQPTIEIEQFDDKNSGLGPLVKQGSSSNNNSSSYNSPDSGELLNNSNTNFHKHKSQNNLLKIFDFKNQYVLQNNLFLKQNLSSPPVQQSSSDSLKTYNIDQNRFASMKLQNHTKNQPFSATSLRNNELEDIDELDILKIKPTRYKSQMEEINSQTMNFDINSVFNFQRYNPQEINEQINSKNYPLTFRQHVPSLIKPQKQKLSQILLDQYSVDANVTVKSEIQYDKFNTQEKNHTSKAIQEQLNKIENILINDQDIKQQPILLKNKTMTESQSQNLIDKPKKTKKKKFTRKKLKLNLN